MPLMFWQDSLLSKCKDSVLPVINSYVERK